MKKILSVILASLFIISAAVSCADKKAAESESAEAIAEEASSYAESSDKGSDKLPLPDPVKVLDTDTSILHDFYINISKTLVNSADGKNVLYSPVNVFAALAILAEAASGNTEAELLSLIGTDSVEKAGSAYYTLYNKVSKDSEEANLLLGSSLWLNENYPHREDCAELIADRYFADIFSGNFADSAFTDSLKSWLSRKTNGFLDGQTDKVKLPTDTVASIVTSLYFKDTWYEGFNEKATKEDTFYTPEGTVDCDFMNRSFTGTYYEGDSFKAIALSFSKTGRMILVIPEVGTEPASLLENGDVTSLLYHGIGETTASPHYAQIKLSLPKFDLTYKTELKEILQSLGVRDVFSQMDADLSDLCKSPAFVSSILHIVRLKIDEEGGEGAAATVVTMAPTSMAPPEEKIELNFNSPFLFSLTSLEGEPLFTGIVNDPTK